MTQTASILVTGMMVLTLLPPAQQKPAQPARHRDSFVVAQHAAPQAPRLPVSEQIPEWCRALPRPEYKSLERILPTEPWFEVYKIAPGVFAIYEPHQAEEVISYLIVGNKQALLFDTGMGIGDIRKITTKLTSRPVVVLNSHTHNDHVGGNWQFARAKMPNRKSPPTNSAAIYPRASIQKRTRQNPGKFPTRFTMVSKSISVAAHSKSFLRPVTRRTPSVFSIASTACSSPATRTIPDRSGCIARKPISMCTSTQ